MFGSLPITAFYSLDSSGRIYLYTQSPFNKLEADLTLPFIWEINIKFKIWYKIMIPMFNSIVQ